MTDPTGDALAANAAGKNPITCPEIKKLLEQILILAKHLHGLDSASVEAHLLISVHTTICAMAGQITELRAALANVMDYVMCDTSAITAENAAKKALAASTDYTKIAQVKK